MFVPIREQTILELRKLQKKYLKSILKNEDYEWQINKDSSVSEMLLRMTIQL